MKNQIVLAVGVMVAACSSNRNDPPQPSGSDHGKTGDVMAASPEPPPPQPKAEKAVFKGPGKKLPQKIPNWSLAGVPRYFGPDNLYDLINGGAEIYVEMGLKEMVTGDYKSKTQPEVTVTLEIYDMGAPLGAFGRVARFLNGQQNPSEAGEGLPESMKSAGLLGETDLIYWKDKFLVHLTVMDESPNATRETMVKLGKTLLPEFAKATWNAIAEEAPFPKEVAVFPTAHRIDRTEAWEPKKLAGVADLGPGFSARYKIGETHWTLFVTSEVNDTKALDTKRQALNSTTERKSSAVRHANRMVGYIADRAELSAKEAALLENQVKELTAAIDTK